MFEHRVENEKLILTKYTGSETDLQVPNKISGKQVIAIGEYCFRSCSSIQTITLPSSVKQIEDGAFWGCNSLEHISLDRVAHLGYGVFQGCIKLRTVIIGLPISTLEPYTFLGCASLQQVTLRGNCSLRAWSFAECSNQDNPLRVVGIGNADIMSEDVFFGATLSDELYANLDPQKRELYDQANALLDAKRTGRGMKKLEQSASMGFVHAQRALGQIYYHGKHRNRAEPYYEGALFWFEQAAELGDSFAQFCLGLMYHLGNVAVERDIEKAKQWYGLAALQGNVDAKNNLGILREEQMAMKANGSEPALAGPVGR